MDGSESSASPDPAAAAFADRLSRALSAAAHGVALIEPDGLMSWINDGFTDITGYTAADALGQRVGQLLFDDEQAGAWFSLKPGEPGRRAEVAGRRKSGETFWADADLRVVSAEDGSDDGFVLTLVDVTTSREEQRRSEAASSALREAARLAGLGGWEIDFRKGEVRYTEELRAMMGHPLEADSFRSAMDVYLPEHREAVLAALVETAQNGTRMDFEAEAMTAAGARIWLRVMGAAEIVDGVCVAIRGASQDITATRSALADLRSSEGFARGVIDGIAAMVAVIDADGRLVEANRTFRETGAAIRGRDDYPMDRSMFDIFRGLPSGHGRALERGVRGVLAGERETFIRAYEAKDGEWFRLSASRFRGEGPVRAVLFTQSVADLKRSERRLRTLNANLKRARDQADAANVAKSAFLATMSHEIRTPLNGVLGMAQAMARDELPEAQRERLAVIRQAGETLLVLLNDLLDLSRIEAGRLELEDGLVDIVRIAEGTQATFTTLAAEKDLYFCLEIEDSARGYWRGDPTRVRQVLYNVVSNAVKFTARGSVQVNVARKGSHLVLNVIDTGPGIAPDRLETLFDKFVQADASTTRKFGGSGLGLAICRELCGLMGGTITVQSVVDQGSSFTVRLPLPPADAPEPAPSQAGPPGLTAHAGRLIRVLAAEDNPMNQLVLKTLLSPMMIDLHIVDDGERAVEAWADSAWDVILMDVQMPRMDGPTATRAIRAREEAEGRPRTPIIALTANAMSHHEKEYLDAGMDALTPKPIELERLLGALDAVLSPDSES
ncbi:ATP-binding protein [Phenylobacterium sp.]|uniref:ATP-binding protein n=1 Tax=Phenylobacterium sp. TaxID=1871053 RepID=UPI0030025453